jgi:hypothetical protein
MTSLADAVAVSKPKWLLLVAGLLSVLIVTAMSVPNLLRSRNAAEQAQSVARERIVSLSDPIAKGKTKTVAESTSGVGQDLEAAAGRRIIRTGSLEMVVLQPAEVAQRIASFSQSLGGYVVRSEKRGCQRDRRCADDSCSGK